jgi:hypothetical protein
MKTKIKNIITSIFGILLMTAGLTFYVLSKKFDFEFSLLELFVVEALGLLLLWAWNAMLQRFVQKTLGIKKDE